MPTAYVPTPVKGHRTGNRLAMDNANQPSSQNITEAEAHYDRPNRFYGAPSTWLSWTQSERETIKALDQERAENLSAHLYVAHKIKKHARSVQNSHLKDNKIRANSTYEARKDDEKPFVPPKFWTAWPVPPEQVPRVFHTTGVLDHDDPFTIKAPPDLRPSAELEECLIATITRTAREKLRAREWENDHESDGPLSGKDTARRKQPVAQHSPSEISQSHPPTSATRSSPSPHPSGSRSRSPSPPQPLPPHASLHPVPIADDDRARTLLLPATRRIITNVNELLMGLHRARTAYARGRDVATNGSETQTATEGSRSKSRSRGAGTRRRKANSRRGLSTNLSSGNLDSSKPDPQAYLANGQQGTGEYYSSALQSSPTSSSPPPSSPQHAPPSRKKRRRSTYRSTNPETRLSRLGLRDWSDVLGMAALTGWDRDVVFRAGERCAKLFGEDMGFRTFWPGAGGQEVEEVLVSGEGVEGDDEEEELEDDGDDHGEIMVTEEEEEEPEPDNTSTSAPSTTDQDAVDS